MVDTKKLIEKTKELLNADTHADIALHFSVSRKQISEWKNGNATPPYAKFIALAESNRINLNWFFWGIGDKYLKDEEVDLVANADDKHYHRVLNIGLNEDEKRELDQVIDGFQYAPKAFIKQVVDRFAEYKKSFLEMKI